jgi:hypothetical protein
MALFEPPDNKQTTTLKDTRQQGNRTPSQEALRRRSSARHPKQTPDSDYLAWQVESGGRSAAVTRRCQPAFPPTFRYTASPLPISSRPARTVAPSGGPQISPLTEATDGSLAVLTGPLDATLPLKSDQVEQ